MTGSVIAHCEILEKLGEGGIGIVHKARNTRLNRFVAIKFLPTGKIADEDRCGVSLKRRALRPL